VEPVRDLFITLRKSAVISTEQLIERISVGFGDVAEAMAVGTNEVLVHGKAPGSTSLIIWQRGGGKTFFDVYVRPNQYLANERLDRVKQEIEKELPSQNITMTSEGEAVFLRGNAKDLISVGRAVSIASTLGKVVNLSYVDVPAAQQQILLKVRFASIDRSVSSELGLNLFSTGATNTIGRTGTGQFSPPALPQNPQQNNPTAPFVFSDLLNVFLFRPDLNLGATLKALETKNLVQILAEPNVMAQDGKEASFLAGGEFPYPVVQSTGTSGVPVVTIQLKVMPEVSSLDFTNGLTIEGFNIPALSTRKVSTEVELNSGQTFAIAGLLDKRLTDVFEKMPLIGDLPVLGKFFQSKKTNRNNTELLVIVTPELVAPLPASAPPMNLTFPKPFMESSAESALRTPGADKTGPVPPPPSDKSMPVEKLLKSMAEEKGREEKQSGGTGPQQDVSKEMQMPQVTPAFKK